jgi:hypothetical protein
MRPASLFAKGTVIAEATAVVNPATPSAPRNFLRLISVTRELSGS